jgi:hypothetical protein
LSASSSTRPAAGAVDDAHAWLRPGERLAREDVAGLVGERGVERDELGAGEKLVQVHLLDAQIDRALRREEWVVGDHLHT